MSCSDLAERLRYARSSNLKDLANEHREKLNEFGIIRVTRGNSGGPGRPSEEPLFNRKQTLYLIAKSGTPIANDLTVEFIEAFDALVERFATATAPAALDPTAARLLESQGAVLTQIAQGQNTLTALVASLLGNKRHREPAKAVEEQLPPDVGERVDSVRTETTSLVKVVDGIPFTVPMLSREGAEQARITLTDLAKALGYSDKNDLKELAGRHAVQLAEFGDTGTVRVSVKFGFSSREVDEPTYNPDQAAYLALSSETEQGRACRVRILKAYKALLAMFEAVVTQPALDPTAARLLESQGAVLVLPRRRAPKRHYPRSVNCRPSGVSNPKLLERSIDTHSEAGSHGLAAQLRRHGARIALCGNGHLPEEVSRQSPRAHRSTQFVRPDSAIALRCRFDARTPVIRWISSASAVSGAGGFAASGRATACLGGPDTTCRNSMSTFPTPISTSISTCDSRSTMHCVIRSGTSCGCQIVCATPGR